MSVGKGTQCQLLLLHVQLQEACTVHRELPKILKFPHDVTRQCLEKYEHFCTMPIAELSVGPPTSV